MNKKVIVHAVIFGAFVLGTVLAWNSVKSEAAAAEEAAEEASRDGVVDPYEDVKFAENRGDSSAGMIKVGVPLIITVIYGGVLTVLYILPMFVDRIGEEMMGSSAEVERDSFHGARAAVAVGDYPEAIQEYRKVWLEHRENRFPIGEIAKIQRTHLESPVVAVSTLKEALDDHEWPEDDAAFLMFRMVDIYEEDLDDKEKVIAILKEVTETLKGTRHAGNATHKLRELGAL